MLLRPGGGHGTISPGPNFAYARCAELPEKRLAGLDLSSWRVASNGAERVRAETLEAFAGRFSSCGFGAHALYPVYGLAEATLAVTAPEVGTGYRVDVERVGLLAPDIRTRLATVGGSPGLSRHFESSVPGLFFVGLPAAHFTFRGGAGHRLPPCSGVTASVGDGRVAGHHPAAVKAAPTCADTRCWVTP